MNSSFFILPIQPLFRPVAMVAFVATMLILFQACDNQNSEKAFVVTDIRKIENKIEIDSHFENAFLKSSSEKFGPFSVQFIPQNIGDIEVTTGKIVVSDGMVPSEIPLKAFFPKGRFSVEIAIASWGEDRRVAFSRIKFNNENPVTWYHANFEGSGPSSTDGFPVDTGTGVYVDYSHRKNLKVFPFGGKFKQINNLLAENLFVSNRNSDFEFCIFKTGYGDGVYSSYVGYDSNGNICRLVSDYGILDKFMVAKEKYDKSYINWLINERTKYAVKIIGYEKKYSLNPTKETHGLRFNSVKFQVKKMEESDLHTLTIEIFRKGSSVNEYNRAFCDIDVTNIEKGKWTEREGFAFDMFMVNFDTIELLFQPDFERTSFQAYLKEDNRKPTH